MSMDSEVELVSTSYGKSGVKILYIRRDAASDDITEYEGSLNWCLAHKLFSFRGFYNAFSPSPVFWPIWHLWFLLYRFNYFIISVIKGCHIIELAHGLLYYHIHVVVSCQIPPPSALQCWQFWDRLKIKLDKEKTGIQCVVMGGYWAFYCIVI